MVDKKEVKGYEVVQVPTQYNLAIQTPEGALLSIEDSVALILNEIKELKAVLK